VCVTCFSSYNSQAGKCGACYPAHGEVAEVAGQCCNSCAEVQSVYRRKALTRLIWEEHTLCQHEALLADPVRHF